MVESAELRAWFCREVLPLEPALMRFIRRHWRTSADLLDIRQDVYARVLEGASRAFPMNAGGYVFTTARNVLINRARHASVVSIELVADIDGLIPTEDWLTPERFVNDREALKRVIDGIDQLPPRCREIIRLRKLEGLGTREVADHFGIGIDAVQQQTMLGMRAITDFLLGGEVKIRRPAVKKSKKKVAKQ